jgi:hypothetical protein
MKSEQRTALQISFRLSLACYKVAFDFPVYKKEGQESETYKLT